MSGLPFLVLSMQLDETNEINCGRLFLYDFNLGHIGHWMATSGLGSLQKPKDWNYRNGGVLPPPHVCRPTFTAYQVQTRPRDSTNIKGIEGNFYDILPKQITTQSGQVRGDFGIHKDANVPGTLGCIGLPAEEFKDFELVFLRYCSEHTEVKLWAQYNYGSYPT